MERAISVARYICDEISWTNARKGLAPNENGDVPLSLDDIEKDAGNIFLSHEKLEKFIFFVFLLTL